MNGMRQHLKVRWIVIERVPVAVMNIFVGFQWAAEMLFHDQAMLQNVAVRHSGRMIRPAQPPIAFGINVASAAPIGIVRPYRPAILPTPGLPITGLGAIQAIAAFHSARKCLKGCTATLARSSDLRAASVIAVRRTKQPASPIYFGCERHEQLPARQTLTFDLRTARKETRFRAVFPATARDLGRLGLERAAAEFTDAGDSCSLTGHGSPNLSCRAGSVRSTARLLRARKGLYKPILPFATPN